MLFRQKWEKIVERLLARVKTAREQAVNEKSPEDPLAAKFIEIENELNRWKNEPIMTWEANLMEGLRALEQQIDESILQKGDKILEQLDLIHGSVESIKGLLEKCIRSSEEKQEEKMSDDQQEHSVKDKFVSKMFLKFEKCYDSLETYELKACYLCLSIFPENSIIKKKPLIYWWIGEGLISKTNGMTAEEVGEEVFEELITDGFLIPKPYHHSPSINCCMVHPVARRALMFLAKGAHFFSFDPRWTKPVNDYGRAFLFSEDSSSSDASEKKQENPIEYLTVFNLTQQYLQLGVWLSEQNSVRVLQLGRWQSNVKHHIEVENEDSAFEPGIQKNAGDVYLNGLGTQRSLRYLSLRGVSRMTSLPPAVANLSSLEILDLRDCQVLQKLDFDISFLKKLTHLDVSECYLLERMPKGINKLLALQVLKGFVIGKTSKDPCEVSDLVDLKQLRKLSIRLGEKASDRHFANFRNFEALQILAISWSGANISLDSFTVPPKLKKLELQCAPISTAPNWLIPDQLKTLEKLYIRGGELSSFHEKYESEWRVKILILKFLKKFRIEEQKLRVMFPNVEYLEKVKCHEGDPDILWPSKTQ